jgi:hypothetical protein
VDVLEGGDAAVYPVIYAHTNTGTIYSSGATGGIAPNDGVVSGGVKIVVEPVGAAAHDTLRMGPAARGEGHGIPDAARAVHVNVAGAIKRCIAEHIITSEVHPCNVKGTCMTLLRC